MGQRRVSEVKVSQMEMSEASEHRDYAEDETDAEVDEIARVNLEKLREEQARRVREMWPSAALDLREIGLTDCRAVFARAGFVGFLNRPDQLQLGHGAAESTKIAFDLAKIANFVAQ